MPYEKYEQVGCFFCGKPVDCVDLTKNEEGKIVGMVFACSEHAADLGHVVVEEKLYEGVF